VAEGGGEGRLVDGLLISLVGGGPAEEGVHLVLVPLALLANLPLRHAGAARFLAVQVALDLLFEKALAEPTEQAHWLTRQSPRVARSSPGGIGVARCAILVRSWDGVITNGSMRRRPEISLKELMRSTSE